MEKELDLTKLEAFINQLETKDESALIDVLFYAQREYGYLPAEIQVSISKNLNIPVSKIYGVVSFYSYFTDDPQGDNTIQVCIGTGCFVKGAERIMSSFEKKLGVKCNETTEDMKFTLAGVRCVGACGLAPVVVVNEKLYGNVKQEEVNNIVEEYLTEKEGSDENIG